jgi:DNA-binding CsgD family transcriptional regulator
MRVEMGADLPLLLQPVCPSPGDPGISDFLRLVAALGQVHRAELVLEPNGGAPSCAYATGEATGPTTTVRLDAGRDFTASLRVGRETRFSEEAVAMLSGALTAILDRHRLMAQTSILRAALDATTSSVLLFDGRGDIVYANPPADRLLSLQTEDELLAETEGEARQPLFTLLSTLVERVSASPHPTAVWKGRLRTADGRIMACEVTHLPRGETRADAVVILLQPIGAEPEIMIDAFSSEHGLSRREHEVLQLLVEGATTIAMADSLGISPHTIRDHLKNLYRKTGTSSRSELLGLVSRATTANTERLAR